MKPVEETPGGIVLQVKVAPKSRKNEVRGVDAGCVKIGVTAPPERGKANRAALDLIADYFGVPKSAVYILSGETSRKKQVCIEGVEASAVRSKLGLDS